MVLSVKFLTSTLRTRHGVPLLTLMMALFPARASSSDAMPPQLDVYITQAVKDWNVPGLAIVIVKDDTVLAAKGYGVRELGRPEKVDGQAMFDVASLTKSFTAAGAAVLVDAGKLDWDARVRERLPAVEFADSCLLDDITLRDLRSHRTGLDPSNSLFSFFAYDRDELFRRVRFMPARKSFRSSMVYNNILYAVAGELTGAVAGTSWAELIRTRLIEPAGMRSTNAVSRPAGGNVASPHARIGGVQKPIPPCDYSMIAPASSIYTNAEDLARWLRLQLNEGSLDGKQIISRQSMVEMHTPQIIIQTTPEQRRERLVEHFPGYGMGWQIMDYRGEPLLWHSGNADGMPSYMALLPEQKLGVAVMMNTWAAGYLHGALVSRMIDAYLPVPERDWSGELLARHKTLLSEENARRLEVDARRHAPAKGKRPLSDYAGIYEAARWGEVRVATQGDTLTMQLARGDKGKLSPWEDDVFLVTWDDPLLREVFFEILVTFTPDAGGRIVRLQVTLNRDTVEVTRRP